jgi:8-oxo-dGTP pyrophosphatase MutT (NUDIX family)
VPDTSADRALRDLAAAADSGRSRVPADAADPAVPVAATVLVLRDGAAGVEVLMIERPDRGSFAGAWVFPGGKVDPADGGPDDDEESVARRAAVRETFEETGLIVSAAELVPISRWDPPPGIALRIRTWFFAALSPGGETTLSADEAVDAAWIAPADMLVRHGRGEATLYPPTWVTLHALADGADAADAESILAASRLAGMRLFETVAQRGVDGPMLLWSGDADHPDTAEADASARHRLQVGALPWVYSRSAVG